MQTSDPLAVRVRGLRKRYGNARAGFKDAVAGLDLDVAHGEIVAVLGPNGAGKTTTVEILEGFRDRDDGEVAVLGEDPRHAGRAWRARIGVVMQDSRDMSELTVLEKVRAAAASYPDPRDPAEVIDAVGLTEKARARTRGLSGGQRRRLDVALGIVGRPELLFLDEPTTGFDPQARRSFWDLVTGLRDDGTTILLTTHYLDEAAQLADRVVVVRDGVVVAEGTPDTLGGPEARTPVVAWDDERRAAYRADRPADCRRRPADRGRRAGRRGARPVRDPPDARGRVPVPDRRGARSDASLSARPRSTTEEAA